MTLPLSVATGRHMIFGVSYRTANLSRLESQTPLHFHIGNTKMNFVVNSQIRNRCQLAKLHN